MLMESLRAAAAIKLFGAEEDRRVLMMNVTVDATNRVLATEKLSMLYRSAQAFLSGTENVLVVYFGAIAVIGGSFSVGMLFAFIAYKTTFSSRVAALIDKSVQVAMLRLQLDRLADIALEEPEQQASDMPAALPDTTIDVRNISFRYGDGEPWVLRNIAFTILPGECVAIVGNSACGKTTLLKILLGLLSPTQGEIMVGGRSLDRIGLRTYRRLVGAVMQEDQLLAGSIAENIAFFDVNPGRARIEACARIAAVHDEILAMPMAYSTLIGDMGSALSGGQKQRILLARALYKQPKLLFLDEATSHLDVKKEREINRAIRLLNCTRILVAHRPETVASADRVIVLDEGTVKQDDYAAQHDEAAARGADFT
jgi:ATP-binding cassette subfamily B protein RaxB